MPQPDMAPGARDHRRGHAEPGKAATRLGATKAAPVRRSASARAALRQNRRARRGEHRENQHQHLRRRGGQRRGGEQPAGACGRRNKRARARTGRPAPPLPKTITRPGRAPRASAQRRLMAVEQEKPCATPSQKAPRQNGAKRSTLERPGHDQAAGDAEARAKRQGGAPAKGVEQERGRKGRRAAPSSMAI